LGGLVRSTGAGMGCPDWPKCFGEWIPPTSENDLPDNYEEIFLNKRKSKVERLVSFLENIGQQGKATQIAQASWLMEHHPYSFKKAYTEYINRVWGALTGIFTLITAVLSLNFLRSKPGIAMFSIAGLVFVIFNGWLGSLVVDTNLFEGMVTLHFIFAFLAFSSFVLAYYWGKPSLESRKSSPLLITASILFILCSAQVLFGSAVREVIDYKARTGIEIGLDNYNTLGAVFNVHRFGSMILLGASIWLFIRYRKLNAHNGLYKASLALLIVFLLQISTGASNLTFDFPAFAQIGHITLGAAAFAICLYLMIQEAKIWRSAS